MPEPYIELHARSAFSFLRGACTPEDYAAQCNALGQKGMALLDWDGFYGSPRFHQAMRKMNLQPYVGAEVGCTDGARYPLLVANRRGYQKLCRLITRAKLRVPKGQPALVTREELAEFAGDWICLTGTDDGPLAQGLRNREGRAALSRLQRMFGKENVYLELQRHFERDEEARNQAVIELGHSLRLPLVATNGVCYSEPKQRELLDAFTCLRHHTTLDRAGRLLERNAERYPKSTEEMLRLFADVPAAVANTAEVAARLKFTLQDLGYEFPHYPAPEGHTEASYLRKLTHEYARDRFQERYEVARPQLEKELNLIQQLGFPGYFLIVWDIVEHCKREGILIQGRGSAANSAVCYALGITAVDSVKMNLLFERFLSENRGEWPDIDLDLPSGDQREKAIQYVYRRYGQLGAAMTANVITYRGRSAAREAGKVLGFDEETLSKLSRLVPMWGWVDSTETPRKHFEEAGLDLADLRVRKFLELTVGLQDLPRHLSQHSGGMVICQGQLDSVVPLEPATMKDRVIVQWDKEDCADLKLIKVDLLGLGMMAVLKESMELIERHHGETIDLGSLSSEDDPKVYAALQQADTIGLFQVESRAQQASLPRMKPETFYDLVVQVAIVRPGPVEGKMAHPYLARRQGKEKPEPLHPCLNDILDRTLGVPLFQEQLLRMAMRAASFTGGEAEELRRAFGFKRSEKRMKEVEEKLRAGMAKNGITGEVQNKITKAITSFAMFGFPESHAASFALLAYASAYLRTYYLAAFTCALLNNQPMGFYHASTVVKDAQRHGLRVLPVDINRSGTLCTLEGGQLRLGFNYVQGLGGPVAEAIVQKQPFSTIGDLALRVPELSREYLERLATIGALNSIGATHRRDALWQAVWAARKTGSLLRTVPESAQESPLRQMTIEERLAADHAGIGMTIGKHPMAYSRAEMDKLQVIPAARLASIPSGRTVRVAGNVIVRQRPSTAKGVTFLSLEDETGISNVVIMPDLFDKQRLAILSHAWVMAEGHMQNVDQVIHILATRIVPLPNTLDVSTHSHDFH